MRLLQKAAPLPLSYDSLYGSPISCDMCGASILVIANFLFQRVVLPQHQNIFNGIVNEQKQSLSRKHKSLITLP